MHLHVSAYCATCMACLSHLVVFNIEWTQTIKYTTHCHVKKYEITLLLTQCTVTSSCTHMHNTSIHTFDWKFNLNVSHDNSFCFFNCLSLYFSVCLSVTMCVTVSLAGFNIYLRGVCCVSACSCLNGVKISLSVWQQATAENRNTRKKCHEIISRAINRHKCIHTSLLKKQV